MWGGGGEDPDLVGLEYVPTTVPPSSIIYQIVNFNNPMGSGTPDSKKDGNWDFSPIETVTELPSAVESSSTQVQFEDWPGDDNADVDYEDTVKSLADFWSAALEVMTSLATYYKKTTLVLSIFIGLGGCFLVVFCLWRCFCR